MQAYHKDPLRRG